MAWKEGPLPSGTYNWGGVVPHGEDLAGGFYFADFFGDHVMMETSERLDNDDVVLVKRRLEPHEVKLYDNSLELPPNCKGRAGPTPKGSPRA